MQLKDLHPNDYYFAEYKNIDGWCIVKGSKALGARPNIYMNPIKHVTNFLQSNMCEASKNVRLATLEEIHWIECCINENEFVSYSEAMLTFVDPSINYQQDSEYNNILIKLLTI